MNALTDLPRGEYPTTKWPAGLTHLPRAKERNAVDLATERYSEVTVTLQDKATCTVRAEWDDDTGPIVHAVRLEGEWLYPDDVLLPARIDCMVAELYVKRDARRFA